MTGPVIRSLERRDVEPARQLVESILREYGLTPDPAGTDADLVDPVTAYAVPGAHFWVLEDDSGAVVGTCALYPRGEGVVELRKMYLAPSARGQGRGRQLLENALTTARRDGATRVELETASVLIEAIGLYRRFGFTRQDTAPEVPRCDQAWALELR